MPESQLSKFRQQFPQYDELSDAAVLTRIHQKHYSAMAYEDFVGRFEGRYGGVTEKKPQDFLDVVGGIIKEGMQYGIDSPMAAGMELVGNVFGIPQKLLTAISPIGKRGQELEPTYTQRLAKKRLPSAILPTVSQIPGTLIPAPGLQSALMDLAIDPILIPVGKVLGIGKAAIRILGSIGKGKGTIKVTSEMVQDLSEVRKYLPEGFRNLGDPELINVIKSGQVARTKEGAFVGKQIVIPKERRLPQPEMVTVGGKKIPSPVLGEVPKLEAEGILESIKRVRGYKEPKPKVVTKVTKGRFVKPEKKAIPEFSAETKSQDAIKLGKEIKGDKGAIQDLKKLEVENGVKFKKAFEKGEIDEAMVYSHKKAMHREAREVATGEGGAAEFVAKEAKGKVQYKDWSKYSKELRKSIGEDIKGEAAGIVADPHRNLRQFLKKNKLKLSETEIAKIHNFAKNLPKTVAKANQEVEFNKYISKNFPRLGIEKPIVVPGKPIAQEVYDASREALKIKSKRTPAKIYQSLKRGIVDVSGNIKKKLLKESGVEGKEVVMHHDLIAGANTKAIRDFNESHSKIYKGLSSEESKVLDDMITSRRIVVIDSYKEGMKHPGGLTGKGAQGYLDSLPDATKKKLTPLMNEYFGEMRNQTKQLLDNGLITDEQFKALNTYDYSPRKFIQHIDPERSYTFGGKKINVPDSGIRSLDEGSLQALETNSKLLLSEVMSRTQNRIFRNRANQALHKLAEVNPENGIIKLFDGKKVPGGFEKISVMIDGKKVDMLMPNEFAKEWVKSDPLISQGIANFIGWASGTKVLKAFATGYNPGFAMSNFPRDIAHIWLTTHEYSKTAPLAFGQMGLDVGKVFKDAVLRKGRFIEYIKEGGGMEFLTHQGKLSSAKRGFWKSLQDVFGYIGETSEILTRLALRERAIKNGLSKIKSTWIARNYLDFSQGGSYIKAFDSGIPYLNAGIQGTRGIFRAAAQKPGEFAYKVGQIGSVATGLYLANKYQNPEAWEQIPEREKINNWIITTPFSFEDGKGNKKHIYFKVAKDQGQRLLTTIFENVAELASGGKINPWQIAKSVQDAIPILPTDNVPPMFDAMLGYAANVDFWRGEDIWKGPKVEAELERTRYTHPFFGKVGDVTGLSPERTKYALQQFFTYGNIYTSIVGHGYNAITKNLKDHEKQFVTEEIILKQPIVRRLAKQTQPYEKYKKLIEDTKLKADSDRYRNTLEYDKQIDKYFTKEKTGEEVVKYLANKKFSTEEKKRLFQRFKKAVKWGNISERRYWMNLVYMNPEARATVFFSRYMAEKNKKEFMAKAINLGLASDRFKKRFVILYKKARQ